MQIDTTNHSLLVALPDWATRSDLTSITQAELVRHLVLSFRCDIRVEELEEQVKLHTPLAVQTLQTPTSGMRAMLRTLATSGATQADLIDLVIATDIDPSLANMYYRLEQWKKWHVIRYTQIASAEPLFTIEPISPQFKLQPAPVDPDTRFVLSRFAFSHRLDDHMILESPLCHARIVIDGSQGAALIAALATPHSVYELSKQLKGISAEVALAAVSLLAQQSILSPLGADETVEEDTDETKRQWAFHDLLFHARSRIGRHDYPIGGLYRFLGKIKPQPAVKPKMSSEVIDLYRPDIEQLKVDDQPFTRVLEERCSVRAYDADAPITLRQLGEFLYRAARVRSMTPLYSTPGQVYEASSRPYPGGGAGYELELYLTVNTCADLPRGIYHYDPLDHQLCKVAEWNKHAEGLIDMASTSAARLCVPQVLVTMASRFQRMGWKYDSMAYAATLKNVGALYQTMYLVATSMGLAPCGLGNGNSDLLVQAVGLDYLKESSVGEFMLGSRDNA